MIVGDGGFYDTDNFTKEASLCFLRCEAIMIMIAKKRQVFL